MNCAIAICVDDFGDNPGVDAAVLELSDMGRVTAVSCMVGGPSWRAGSAALRNADAERLDAGLHLDLTEHPVDASLRHSVEWWMAASLARIPRPARLKAEIEAQLTAFEDATGRIPTHVDGHQHVHQFPVVREALVEVLAGRYGGNLPWLRRTQRARHTPHALKAAVIDGMGCDALTHLAEQNGFMQNEHLLGVYDFRGGAGRYRSLLHGWFHAARQRDLLMCHPMRVTGAGSVAHHAARAAEFKVFSSPTFDDLLVEAGVSVAPLRKIGGS